MPDLNSDTPWVSFCMSTYRRTGFLHETLAIIRAQTFTDFEVVISDNDPDASGSAVVEAFGESRFRYFHNGDNLGMVASFNKSIERSRGQYIVMITDDDPVYPDMLKTLHRLWVEYPGYGLYIGGHDNFFHGLEQAKLAGSKVGTNSGLAEMELGAERVFSPAEFPEAFLNGPLAGILLWSTGIVRRDIALAVGGFPDYGTPHMADNSYILLSGVRAGCVYVNTALGYRAIHNENYSYREANYESIYKAPDRFYQWTVDRLPPAVNTAELRGQLEYVVGRDMTVYVISIKKMLQAQGVESKIFEDFRQRFFKLPFLQRWKRKYDIAVHFPNSFRFFLALRGMLSPSSSKKTGR
ncbi:MAG TPA: glycosyltransferase [Puia sp.]|jgi:glycosyltransferase involved in cell wall biosynthesis